MGLSSAKFFQKRNQTTKIFQTIILTKNSPLTPVLKQGMLAVKENSLFDHLRLRWLGKSIARGDSGAEKTVLTTGQVETTKHCSIKTGHISPPLACHGVCHHGRLRLASLVPVGRRVALGQIQDEIQAGYKKRCNLPG